MQDRQKSAYRALAGSARRASASNLVINARETTLASDAALRLALSGSARALPTGFAVLDAGTLECITPS